MRIGAELGYAMCQKHFSDVLRRQKDHANEVAYARRAAVQGLAEAQAMLGSYYEYGQRIEKNRRMALCWIRRSADLDGIYGLETYEEMRPTQVTPLGAR